MVARLDFEEARHDCRLVNLVRGAVMLGTRFRGWGPVLPGTRAAFLEAYAAATELDHAERAWLPVVELWCALAMVPHGPDDTGWGRSAADLAAALEAGQGARNDSAAPP